MSDALGIAVLISGNGTTLQALLDAQDAGDLNASIVAVLSNRRAPGLTRAVRASVPTHVIEPDGCANREAHDAALARAIEPYRPDLVLLAGYMRVLSERFVNRYRGRVLNIHPSLLPDYKGLDTYARALADGVREHGSTVHYVEPALDDGPGLVQAVVPVLRGDDPSTLSARVQAAERRIYPMAVRWVADGRVEYRDGRIYMDKELLAQPVRIALPNPATASNCR